MAVDAVAGVVYPAPAAFYYALFFCELEESGGFLFVEFASDFFGGYGCGG